MHLRAAHRYATTHFGGHGAISAHVKNVAQARLDNKKDIHIQIVSNMRPKLRTEHRTFMSTLAENNPAVLFKPFTLKNLILPNRIVMAPMTRSKSPRGIPAPK